MSLSDVAWLFTAVIFAAIVGCVVWTMKEKRKK